MSSLPTCAMPVGDTTTLRGCSSRPDSSLEKLRARSEALSLPELLTLLPSGFAERSVGRWLSELEDEGRVVKTGRKRGTRYRTLGGFVAGF